MLVLKLLSITAQHSYGFQSSMLIAWRKLIPEKPTVAQLIKKFPTHNVSPCLKTLPCSQDPTTIPYSEPDHSSSMPAILSISLNFTSCIPCAYNNLQSATTSDSVCKLKCPWHSHCTIKLYFSIIHFKITLPPIQTSPSTPCSQTPSVYAMKNTKFLVQNKTNRLYSAFNFYSM